MEQVKILPKRLKRGDKIGMIAPADPVFGVCSDQIKQQGYLYLKQKGFDVVEGVSMTQSIGHTAGTVEARVKDIHDFFSREDIGCIMAFWGGLNTNQLLNHLDYELIRRNPKILVGYSDVTALTSAITKKTGMVTFSGPAGISFSKPEPFDYTWEYFSRLCIEGEDPLPIVAAEVYADDKFYERKDDDHRIKTKNEGIKIYQEGATAGEIVGGNLQTLLVLNGTEFMPDLTGKILFIEEDETSSVAMVERLLTQCKQMGVFLKVAGVVFGRFTSYSGFNAQDSLESVLSRVINNKKIPVLYNLDFGHSDPLITIPNGGMCMIEKDKLVLSRSVSS